MDNLSALESGLPLSRLSLDWGSTIGDPLTLAGCLCRERSLQLHDGVKEQFVALA